MTIYTSTLEIQFSKGYELPENVRLEIQNRIENIFRDMNIDDCFENDDLEFNTRASCLYKDSVYIPPVLEKRQIFK